MFVEIVRVLIVTLCTAAGYVLSRRGADPGNLPALGAAVGALVGYVAGGVFGRLLRRAMGVVEQEVVRYPAAQLLAGTVGATGLGLLCALLGFPAVALIPDRWGWPLWGILVWMGMYEGFQLGAGKSAELLAMAGLSTRVPLERPGVGRGPGGVLVDTSALVDGRLSAVAEAGFLRDTLFVPRFVLDEVQFIADSADDVRRRRGRRALEALDALRVGGRPAVVVVDHEVPELEAVDAKLVALARRLHLELLTTDFNLQKVAELQGVRCLNLHRLAEGLRPVLVPGEVVRLPITREGKEQGQGVGFLEDGTMVVVSDAAELVGEDVAVRITSTVQTSMGRMLFASVAPV